MRFTSLSVAGSYLVEPEPVEDARGFFARTFCRDEFESHGLNPELVQCSVSFNRQRGTLRGLHYQKPPHAEAKLVRCTAGAIHDVVLDLRPDSPSYLRWEGLELNAGNRRAVYIPEGCAHGFMTLVDASEVFYQMSAAYHPASSAGVRWNDPAFGIEWPAGEIIISERDSRFELWRHEADAGIRDR
jgi:dTDP-4-dehydrorhamnose 3,5-epimerase